MENLITGIRPRLELNTSRIQVYIVVSRSDFSVNAFFIQARRLNTQRKEKQLNNTDP
jgi:hypothetical protein